MDEFRRQVIKQGNGVATVPPSADHRNGDWISSDIYEGELYLDLDSGLTYSRDSNGITLNGNPLHKIYKAILTQSGTSAPTVDLLILNTVGTVTLSRTAVGRYRLTSTGNFGTNCFFYAPPNFEDTFIEIARIDANSVEIITTQGGTDSDSILNKTSIYIEVYG